MRCEIILEGTRNGRCDEENATLVNTTLGRRIWVCEGHRLEEDIPVADIEPASDEQSGLATPKAVAGGQSRDRENVASESEDR